MMLLLLVMMMGKVHFLGRQDRHPWNINSTGAHTLILMHVYIYIRGREKKTEYYSDDSMS